jgi:uncharacterized protein YdcH (DUF465 family)
MTNKEIIDRAIKRIENAQKTASRETKTELNIALLYLKDYSANCSIVEFTYSTAE